MTRFASFVPAVLLLFAAGSVAAIETSPGVKEVEDCMRRNIPVETLVSTFKLSTQQKSGSTDEKRGTLWWKRENGRSKVRLLVLEPADIRGSGVLLVEGEGRNDIFVYLPDIKRVRRVTGRTMAGSVFGSDFTYEQLERMQQMAQDARVERAPDQTLDGQDAYVLEGRPAPGEDTEIERVVTFVDKKTCLPVRMLFYESGKPEPQRQVDVDRASITKESSGFVARRIVARNPAKERESELLLEKIEIGKPLPERHFSQAALEAEGH